MCRRESTAVSRLEFPACGDDSGNSRLEPQSPVQGPAALLADAAFVLPLGGSCGWRGWGLGRLCIVLIGWFDADRLDGFLGPRLAPEDGAGGIDGDALELPAAGARIVAGKVVPDFAADKHPQRLERAAQARPRQKARIVARR